MGNRRLTDNEREQRRKRARQRLKHATEQLLSSDGWQRWVRVRSRNGLARYSVNNQLLIALARPDASYVAGFHAWLELGYQVRKGERAIWILAPMPVKNRETTDEERDESRVFFRAVPVFDRAQVNSIEGTDPTPLEPPCEPLIGDSHHHLLDPLESFAAALGYSVSFAPIAGGTGGWCDHDSKRIAVDGAQPGNSVRILVHELAHALGVGYPEYGRHQAEVIVDTVTFIVCAGAGLDISGESIPYIAAWGENGALDAVTKFAGVIDTIARQLEDTITTAEESDERDTQPVAVRSSGEPPAGNGAILSGLGQTRFLTPGAASNPS